MKPILFLPLDERPCNYSYQKIMCEGCDEIELKLPPYEMLGDKKEPADVDRIREWIESEISHCEAAILSIDMLLYGGIIPSRLHNISENELIDRLELLRKIKRTNPSCKLFCYNLIMRAPAYSSSEEEPDYYETHGKMIFDLGYLTDKSECADLSTQENENMESYKSTLPSDVLDNFSQRRKINHRINKAMIDMVNDKTVDFLVVPLDDCAQHGWASREHRLLRELVIAQRLSDCVYMYSGADEVGSVLLARAVNEARQYSPGVWLRYSTVNGPHIIPTYEDRPLGENLKWQIITAGGHLCDHADQADFVLMINAPTMGREGMADALYGKIDASYYSQRCLPEFVNELSRISKPIALADVTFANGGDNELMNMLCDHKLLGRLSSYAAWNTAANSIGTCIAHMMIQLKCNQKSNRFLKLRLLEDWAYMANIRGQANTWLMARNKGYFDFGGLEAQLKEYVSNELQLFADKSGIGICMKDIAFPWRRLFEIAIDFESI